LFGKKRNGGTEKCLLALLCGYIPLLFYITMKILAIETSCDETALAIVDAEGGLAHPRITVQKSLVASQISIHRPFGGVVPTLAKREHLKNLPILYRKIFDKEHIAYGKKPHSHKPYAISRLQDIDLLAVTVGPGLEPALWAGITFAKSLIRANSDANKRESAPQLVGVNHLEGHLYSFLLAKRTANPKPKTLNSKQKGLEFRNLNLVFPAIALLVSGGHTELLLLTDMTRVQKLGETFDDAAGEAFDKVARLLGLSYPGGPEIEKLAAKGDPAAIAFPRPMLHQKNYNFSFSGLKTAVLYYLRDPKLRIHPNDPNVRNGNIRSVRIHSDISERLRADVAASFQQAAIDVLVAKTMRAAREYGAKSIMLSGGVAANKRLRETLRRESAKYGAKFYVADIKYNTDNAVMIAVAAYIAHLRKKKYKLEAQGNLNL
jgi:N6-L-threonylcarbamoyladenine synthase